MSKSKTRCTVADMRVLGRIRLSRLTEESTSEDRQREAIEQWASMHGHEIIGFAKDMDVSGSLSPYETPELGPYLTEAGMTEWDILCAYRLDRISRRVVPLNQLFGDIMKHGKSLVSVSESIDLSTWVGRMVANVIAGVAEGELEAITERTQGSQKKLRAIGRWHGGSHSYGYQPVKRDGGWYLEPHPEHSKVVRRILEGLLANKSGGAIASELNADKIPPPRGKQWHSTSIRRMFQSHNLLGQTEYKGRPVTDDSGMPVQFNEPLVTYDEWKRANAALADTSKPKKRSHGQGLLTNVAFCGHCEHPMYRHMVKGGYDYWRCGASLKKSNGCTAVAAKAGPLEEFVYDNLMEKIGNRERKELVYQVGEDSTEELDRVTDALETLRKEKDLGLYEGDEDSYLLRAQKLVERRNQLRGTPSTPSGYVWKGLGETYQEAWDRMDVTERREMLLESRVQVYVKTVPFYHPHVIVPADL